MTRTPRTTTLPKDGASQPPDSHPSGPDVHLSRADLDPDASDSAPVGAGIAVMYGGIRVNRNMYSENGIRATRTRLPSWSEELRVVTDDGSNVSLSPRYPPLDRYVNSMHCISGTTISTSASIMCRETEKLTRRECACRIPRA